MTEALQDTTEPAPEAATEPEAEPALLPGTLTQIMAMPVWIVRSAPLIALRRRSPLALRVLLCLWAHGRGVGSRCFPGERRLAALNKTSVPSVSRAISLLEAAKWITVERQLAQGQGNRYVLRLPEELAIPHTHAAAWLARPSTGKDAPPVEDTIQQGDLWGRAGQGRRRFRQARIEAAAMNSALWDEVWRENALAGHLWLLLQAYGPSGEQVSLKRLGRELDAQPSAISVGLRFLRAHGLLTASVTGRHGTRHTVAAPPPDATLRAAGAVTRPGKGRSRRTGARGADGRWLSQGGHRARRTLSAPAPRPPPRPPPPKQPAAPPVMHLERWCRTHGGMAGLEGDLRYGGQLGCGCIWTPTEDDMPDARRPAGYRAA